MNADYNPQLGKRRTLFPDREDYLVNVEYIQEQGDGLVLTAYRQSTEMPE